MKANERQMRSALDAPSPDVRFYLLHGPDEAGARSLAARLGRALGPDAERIDIEPAVLRGDPARLADEAAALSLFGTARHIRVSNIGDESADAVAALLAAPRTGNPVVAVAPGLKATSRLVKLAIADPGAMALACYVPEGADAERLADQMARERGMRLTGGVAQRLAAAAAGDRAVMARELDKLALYVDAAPDSPREADIEAYDAIGAGIAEGEASAAIDAIIDGRGADAAAELHRLAEAGGSTVPLLRALARRLLTLAELRAQIDGGARIADVTQRLFFRERDTTQRALRRWTAPRLNEAIARVRAGERAVTAPGNAGHVVAHAALIAIARGAARLG